MSNKISPGDDQFYHVIAVGGGMSLDQVERFFEGPKDEDSPYTPPLEIPLDEVKERWEEPTKDYDHIHPVVAHRYYDWLERELEYKKLYEVKNPIVDNNRMMERMQEAAEANAEEFKKASEFAEKNGLTAVLVSTLQNPSNLAYIHSDDITSVIYLDQDGKQVEPEGAPKLSFEDRSGKLEKIDLSDFGDTTLLPKDFEPGDKVLLEGFLNGDSHTQLDPEIAKELGINSEQNTPTSDDDSEIKLNEINPSAWRP